MKNFKNYILVQQQISSLFQASYDTTIEKYSPKWGGGGGLTHAGKNPENCDEEEDRYQVPRKIIKYFET